jgi:uncharacterized protein (DUF305 family)
MHRSISSPSSLRGGSYAWRYGVTAGALVLLAACGGSGAQAPGTDTTPAPATGPRVVQAGAPGESSRPFAAGNLDDLEGASYTEADVSFMQGMIHHHAQALQMTSLIGERTTTRAIEQMGLRMQISQGDEISIMERWLRDRGLEVPVWSATPPAHSMHHGTPGHEMMDHAAMDHGDEHAMMAGMLTPEQMAQLEAARGRDFDRLFPGADDPAPRRSAHDGHGSLQLPRSRAGVDRVPVRERDRCRSGHRDRPYERAPRGVALAGLTRTLHHQPRH